MRRTALRPGQGPSRSTGLRRTGFTRRKPLLKPKADTSGPVEFSAKVERLDDDIYGGHCALCETPTQAYHHRQMRSAGGLGLLVNCLPVCVWHHRLIHDNSGWSMRFGLLVSSQRDPATVEVRTPTEPAPSDGSARQ